MLRGEVVRCSFPLVNDHDREAAHRTKVVRFVTHADLPYVRLAALVKQFTGRLPAPRVNGWR